MLKNVLIRCEYSDKIGMGHLMRCLAIAKGLSNKGISVHILSKTGRTPEAINAEYIHTWHTCIAENSQQDASQYAELYQQLDAGFSILDMYGITDEYQQVLVNNDLKWLQFDGAAKEAFWGHILLSVSPVFSIDDYKKLVRRADADILTGPRYAILREEFLIQPAIKIETESVVLSFGGGDDRGATLFCLKQLNDMQWGGHVNILSGQSNPELERIKIFATQCQTMTVDIHVDSDNFAELLASSTIAIIAGGMTTFEAATLGIPFLIIQIADNQKLNAAAWQKSGVALDLGALEGLSIEQFRDAFLMLMNNSLIRERMSNNGRGAVDGKGTERVVRKICEQMAL